MMPSWQSIAMPVSYAYKPAPIHQGLGDQFYDSVEAADFPLHRLRYRNQRWARPIGLNAGRRLSCAQLQKGQAKRGTAALGL